MAKRQELNSQLRMVSSRVACEVLGVTSQTLRRWAKQSKIGAIKTPGGHYRYDLSGLIVSESPAAPPQPRRSKLVAASSVKNATPAQVDIEDVIAAAPPPQVLPGVQMSFAADPIMPRPPMGPDLRSQIERLASSSHW
jgi:excisionase family DNA binding protein